MTERRATRRQRDDASAELGDRPSAIGAGDPRVGTRRARIKTRHTVAKVIGTTLLVLGMVSALGAAWLYRELNSSFTREDVDGQLTNRPEKIEVEAPQEPLNILVLGDDTRSGDNAIDNETGGGSDTTILMHLSGDRESAYGISIPRDSLVDRPSCTSESGSTIPGELDAVWNAAYSVGGAACTIQQFEQLTEIRIDNYVVVDFAGFSAMVDAIGGVDVCIPEDISDPEHGIQISAGTRSLTGQEALNYVRVRNIGDGSDISRIKRQQAFIAAMAQRVVSSDTLTKPTRVISFLKAALSSLTTDFGSLRQLGQLGYSFNSIGLDNVKFVTVPFEYSTAEPGRVEWLPQAQNLWETVRRDQPLSKGVATGAISADNVPGLNDGQGDRSGRGASSNASDDELASAGLCT